MDENSIRKYAVLMKELGLTGLEIDENGGVVRLEMNSAAAAQPLKAEQQLGTNAAKNGGDCYIRSPMVGVFYTAPSESAEAYVKEGDNIKKGDIVCIIEAMKLMNEVTAECDGVVLEVCADNGQVVDYGCPLFRIGREVQR